MWDSVIGINVDDTEPDYQVIPTSFYTLSKDDSTWSADLGHNVTTVTMYQVPQWVPYWFPGGFDIFADVGGITDDNTPTGAVITDFSDAINDMLQNRIGVGAGDINAASFAATKSELTAWLEIRGVIDRVQRGSQILAWLAFQCRSLLRFEAGEIYLDYLSNAMGSNVTPTIGTTIEYMDELELSFDSPDEVVNEIEYTFRGPKAERKTGKAIDTDSISAYGRKSVRANFTLIAAADQAEIVGGFWVYRWGRPWRRGQVSCVLATLPFQRNDAVTVDFDNWSLDSVPAEITDVRHTPGDDAIRFGLRFPFYSGCATSCEAFCETGSETIAVTTCTGACETADQAACTLVCMTRIENRATGCAACELGNQVVAWDMEADWIACGLCETACQSCQGSCVSSCESGCETDCEVASTTNECDTSCIVGGGACETASECGAACETDCMTGCETVVEGPCGEGCQVACEVPACQTGCEVYGQACGGSCEVSGCETTGCEVGCETGCETASTSNDCDTSCIVGACESQCEVGGCETSCETGDTTTPDCDLACETNAMSSCAMNDTTFAGF